MAQNIVEKIVQRFAVGLAEGQEVHGGDFIAIKPAHVMTHDNTGAVIKKFKSLGARKLADSRQAVFALDHNVQDDSPDNRKKYATIESFARDMGIDFYPAGRGIGHQIMVEEGYAWPGTMAVASDSHSNMYGGLGCLGSPIVRTDAAAIWATGRTWWQVPPIARLTLRGKLQPGVTGKDVIIALCGFFNQDEVLNHAIEFGGDGITLLSLEQRLAIANMTTEWGALAGLFPCDEVTIAWLRRRVARIEQRGLAGVPSDRDGQGHHPRLFQERVEQLAATPLRADHGAAYAQELEFDLDSVVPSVSGPDHVKVMHTVAELAAHEVTINKAYLLSCVNARVEDLAEAARVVAGKKVAPGVKLYLAAASSEVQAESEQRGDWQTLLDAGAIPLLPGCGPCIGLGTGLLEDGEVGISATNRNFKGRMGSRNAQAYLASPAIVAASALAGKIAAPWPVADRRPTGTRALGGTRRDAKPMTIVAGFQATVTGELLWCHQDNLNTDGIYPGKYTYVDDFTPQQQAGVVMENYDPQFRQIMKPGDILAGGFNFGTGSSREQAATAFKFAGIAMVIAGTFNETYKRNAINNGFLTVESPELVETLKQKIGTGQLTVKTGLVVTVDFTRSMAITPLGDFPISPIGPAVQELIIVGGLEPWVIKQLNG